MSINADPTDSFLLNTIIEKAITNNVIAFFN